MRFLKLLLLTAIHFFSIFYLRAECLSQGNSPSFILPATNGNIGQVLGLVNNSGQLAWLTTFTNILQSDLVYSATSASIPLTLVLRDSTASFAANNLMVTGTQFIMGNVLVTGSVVGAVFYEYPTSSAVGRTAQNKLNDRVDIKDFGALGNGVNNDLPALVNALSSLVDGGNLYIPSGTYLLTVTSEIFLPNNITISGDGRRNTVLEFSNGSSAPTVTFLMNNAQGVSLNNLGLLVTASSLASYQSVSIINIGAACSNFLLDNVQLNGNMSNLGSGLNYYAYGLNFPNTGTQSNIFINQCELNNLYYPFFNAATNTSNQQHIYVLNSTFYNNYASDIYFNNPLGNQSDIVIDGCDITSNLAYLLSTSGNGIALNSGKDIRIRNNYIAGIVYNAIHLEQDISNFVVEANIIETDGVGIMLMANNQPFGGTYYMPQNGTLLANSINLTGTTVINPRGIALSGGAPGVDPAENITIADNIISGNYYIGIEDECSLSSMSIIKENLVQGAITGFNFMQGGYSCDQNISSNCSVGIQGTNASVNRHIFHDCIVTASATSQPLQIINPLVEFDLQTLLVTTTQFPLVRLGAQDRLSANGVIYVRGISNSNALSANAASVTWTGAALNIIPLITLEPGNFISTFTLVNNMLALQVTSTLLTSNVVMEVSLDGLYVMSV